MANTTTNTTEPNNFIDNLDGTGATGTLRFPISTQNEIPNWITFTRKKYQKPDLQSASSLVTADNSKIVALPLPNQLNNPYSAQWSQENIGAVANQYYTGINNGANIVDATKAYHNAGNNWLSSMVDAVKNNSSFSGAVDYMKILAMDVGKGALDATVLDLDTLGIYRGFARNPFKALSFETQNFRTFNFAYKLVAKNLDEANAIRDIIKEFHIGMSPTLNSTSANYLYDYPDLYVLNLTDDSYLFKFAPCVLSECIVSYHGEDTPLYFRGKNGERVPASVEIQLSFKEAVVLSRQDFQNGY